MKNVSVCIVPLILLVSTGCGKSPQQYASSAQAAQAPTTAISVPADAKGVQVITVQDRNIPNFLQIPGRVAPDPTRVVHVFAAAGGRLLEMRVRPGDRVQQGQVLALLESSDVSRALSDEGKARADAEVKKKALNRAQDLYAHHAIAEKDLEGAQADSQMSDEEEKATRDHLRLLGVDPATPLDQLRVLAPRVGVVLDTNAAVGELSKSLDDPQPLCTIADLSTVWIEGQVFEKDAASVKTGTPAQVTLSAYPNQTWSGRISVVSDSVDPVTRTLKVRVVLANPDLRLKPDMFANIRLLVSTAKGILIPSVAVVREGENTSVFVATGSNHYERRQITLGRAEGDQVEVTSGLSAGTAIASEGALLLRDAEQN